MRNETVGVPSTVTQRNGLPPAQPEARAGSVRPGPSLARLPVGTVPILWNNVDVPDVAPRVPGDVVLDEIARLGFAGTQSGWGFPEGAALGLALRGRSLRLAEVYAALPCTVDGPTAEAEAAGRAALAALHSAGGEVLVAALALSQGRIERAGRAQATDTPRLTTSGWAALGRLLDELSAAAAAQGHVLAFHPHAGTFVETPDEVERLLAVSDAATVGLCLDIGHYTVGGGDPVKAIRRHGRRVRHVHVKDVASEPLAGLREGTIGGFLDALRARLFTELGAGVVDVAGVLGALATVGYDGWLILEQDTTWRPPSESAAISRRVLDYAIHHLDGVAAA